MWNPVSHAGFLGNTSTRSPFRPSFELRKMKASALLLISFTCLGRLSLAKEGKYNEAEQALPSQEWLDPWDMIHYDATVQSLDKTVSFVAYLIASRANFRPNLSSLNILVDLIVVLSFLALQIGIFPVLFELS